MISQEKYIGCFLGLLVGDVLGAPHEGGPLERLAWRIIGKTKEGKQRYSDDTQMAIAVAHTFLQQGKIDQDQLAITFADYYQWSRGYGPSTSRLLKKIKQGKHWATINKKHFKDGSLGNGATMRAPIITLCFPSNIEALSENVEKFSIITHAHPLGIEGAQLIARTTFYALHDLDNNEILDLLLKYSIHQEYQNKLNICKKMIISCSNSPPYKEKEVKQALGNDCTALGSSITAIYYALKFRKKNFHKMLTSIFKLGGDTDTIAAMAGAIWGTFNGSSALSINDYHNIESYEEIEILARKLHTKNFKTQT